MPNARRAHILYISFFFSLCVHDEEETLLLTVTWHVEQIMYIFRIMQTKKIHTYTPPIPLAQNVCKSPHGKCQFHSLNPSADAHPPAPNPIDNSHNHAADTIHCPLNLAPNLIPVRPPFRKLIDFLGAKDAVETVPVRDDGRELLRVRGTDQVYLRELAERHEELEEVLVLERLYVCEVEVDVAAMVLV